MRLLAIYFYNLFLSRLSPSKMFSTRNVRKREVDLLFEHKTMTSTFNNLILLTRAHWSKLVFTLGNEKFFFFNSDGSTCSMLVSVFFIERHCYDFFFVIIIIIINNIVFFLSSYFFFYSYSYSSHSRRSSS